MELTDNELRSLIAAGGMNIGGWAQNPDVMRKPELLKLLDRLRELAEMLKT